MAQADARALDLPKMKRKHSGIGDAVIPASGTTSAAAAAQSKRARTGPAPPHMPNTLPMQPHEDVLAELKPKYDVKPMSVISSTPISKRVEQVLAHLGRFHPSDMSVLPGVVLVHARADQAGKMTSVVELVKRQVHEAEQKWFQYNRLYEVSVEPQRVSERSVIEDTVLGGYGSASEDEEDGFEVMQTPFERAVLKEPKVTTKPYMSIILSRVPISELQSKDYITTQSNSDQIEYLRKKRLGII